MLTCYTHGTDCDNNTRRKLLGVSRDRSSSPGFTRGAIPGTSKWRTQCRGRAGNDTVQDVPQAQGPQGVHEVRRPSTHRFDLGRPYEQGLETRSLPLEEDRIS